MIKRTGLYFKHPAGFKWQVRLGKDLLTPREFDTMDQAMTWLTKTEWRGNPLVEIVPVEVAKPHDQQRDGRAP